MKQELRDFLSGHALIGRFGLSEDDTRLLAAAIEQEYMAGFLLGLIQDIEDIMGVDPRMETREILETAAERIVKHLGAEAASIRLFEPETLRMTSYGAYRFLETERPVEVSFVDSIAGQVVRENKSIPVSSILKHPSYQNKEIVKKKGFHSLLALPLRIPKFMEAEDDLMGALQIYYREEDRKFSPLEIMHAELLARRVSYVLTKKKLIELQQMNDRKETIVDKIFVKLSEREGIRLKDLFVLLIPELGEFLQVQSCSLFTVSRDRKFIRLEAAYPLDQTYHEPGYTFTVSHHPYFQTVIHGSEPCGDFEFERIDPAYLLIKGPESRLISPGIRNFIEEHRINSVLVIPLKVDESIRYLMMFYATDQRQYFRDEEIELLTFLGREIMKASRLERLDDVLHDLKNPAIAISGFAARCRKLLDNEDLEAVREKLHAYLSIIVDETARLQDLTLAMNVEGREEVMDLSQVVERRSRINEQAIRELRKTNIRITPPELEFGLQVTCSRYGLERVIDNVLNNATRAVPEEGGTIGVNTSREDAMAVLQVRNTGEIPRTMIEQIRSGEVRGRGLGIIYRFVQANHGRMDIDAADGETVVTVRIPLSRT
ncbi:MAG: GAF domain-containing sensor histidine kinase [bacterium]|nr:GAF domain-containing sensor histidine kinase [bacterium]